MTHRNNSEDFHAQDKRNFMNIPGWGVDADPKNDPTYPMRKRSDSSTENYVWERPVQQQSDIEVLHSVERPNLTAVYGSSAPPRGLSGSLRRWAFRYSESTYAHWLPLILADRVDVVEGLIKDIQTGQFPNIFKEKGLSAQWKYNRKSFLKKNLLLAGAGIATFFLVKRLKNKHPS